MIEKIFDKFRFKYWPIISLVGVVILLILAFDSDSPDKINSRSLYLIVVPYAQLFLKYCYWLVMLSCLLTGLYSLRCGYIYLYENRSLEDDQIEMLYKLLLCFAWLSCVCLVLIISSQPDMSKLPSQFLPWPLEEMGIRMANYISLVGFALYAYIVLLDRPIFDL